MENMWKDEAVHSSFMHSFIQCLVSSTVQRWAHSGAQKHTALLAMLTVQLSPHASVSIPSWSEQSPVKGLVPHSIVGTADLRVGEHSTQPFTVDYIFISFLNLCNIYAPTFFFFQKEFEALQ